MNKIRVLFFIIRIKIYYYRSQKFKCEYVNRVYYFYSDEDVFYVICESRKENSEAAAKEFDEFISGVTITKK